MFATNKNNIEQNPMDKIISSDENDDSKVQKGKIQTIDKPKGIYQKQKINPPVIITTRDQRVNLIRPRVKKDPTGINPAKLEALYKIVLIGDSGVGKTSLLLRFSDNIFSQSPLTTIGLDFKMKTMKVDNRIIKMQIWDTAGQERFRSISQTYFRNAHGCIAVYDITRKESFNVMEQQILEYLAI